MRDFVTLLRSQGEGSVRPDALERVLDRVAELERKNSAAVAECAKAKDDLRRLEDETQWSEGTLIVDGREVGIRMRGSMFVLRDSEVE
jgi:hypothetical protein